MAYVENRIIHDADSHLMELADCLDDFLDPQFRAGYDALAKLKAWPRDGEWVRHARAQQDDPDFRLGDAANLMLRKNYSALGSFRREDRPKALDALGFASQLVFTTWSLGNFGLDESGNVALCYGVAEAHNRMMTHFCSVDRRLLATAYIPLVDFEQTKAIAARAINGRQGAAHPVEMSERPFAEPHRIRFLMGDGGRSGSADPLSRRRRGKAQAGLLRQWSAACEGFPRRRREFHLGQLYGDPAFGDEHAGRVDLRSRARSFSEVEIWCH